MTSQSIVERRPQGRRSTLERREAWAGIAFISPWIIGFLVFTAGPMVLSLGLSLTDYSVLQAPKFVGLANYQHLLTDPKVGLSLANSFIYTALFVPTSTVVALGLALLLNRVGKAAGFFRTVFYLPSITPAVAVGTLWLWILNPRVGLLNRGLALLGIAGPGWTTDAAWIKPGIVMMTLWGLGSTIIIYLAALRNVPPDLYEASSIDGAGAWRQFTRITLPMISGAIFFTVIVNTIAALQVFDQVYTMNFGTMKGTAGAASNRKKKDRQI